MARKDWFSKSQIIKALIRDGINLKNAEVRLSQFNKRIPENEKKYIKTGSGIEIRYSEIAYTLILNHFSPNKER